MMPNSNRQNSNKLQHEVTSVSDADYHHNDNNSADCLEPTDEQRLHKPRPKDSFRTGNNVSGRKGQVHVPTGGDLRSRKRHPPPSSPPKSKRPKVAIDLVDEKEASDSLYSLPPHFKWPTKIATGASHLQISLERKTTSGNRIHTPRSLRFSGVGFAESNDCNQSSAPSPSRNGLANDRCQQLSCDQTGALVLTHLQRGERVLYRSSIHKHIFWFRCGDQSFKHDTIGTILFTDICELITKSESRMVMLRFKTPDNMFRMIFKRLEDADIFREQLRPHVTFRSDR
jgi:hypothetical protein